MLGAKSIARDLGLAVLGAVLLSGAAPAQLALSTRAAITDNYGVEVQQDGTSRRVFAMTQEAAGREHLEFKWNVDFSSANVLTGQSMTIFEGRDQQGVEQFWIDLIGDPTGLQLRAYAKDGAATMFTANAPVSAVHHLVLEWQKGPSGLVRFEVDHADVGSLPGIDTDRVLLSTYYGAPRGMTGLTGWYAFDDVWIDDLSGAWPEQMAIWIEQPYNEGVP